MALCLLTWPTERRRRHGPAMLAAVEGSLADAARGGRRRFLREVAGEAAALAAAGLAIRGREAVRAGAAGAAGALSDGRFALRTLLRSPGFTLVAVATLALGIGANAAVFGLVDAALFEEPSYRDPDRLVLVWNTLPGSDERVPVAGPDAAVLRERSRALAEVAFLMRPVDGSIEPPGGNGAEHVRLAGVTTDLFRVLGVAPALGRGFVAEDALGGPAGPDGAEAVSVAVLSHDAWRRLFGGDPAVVGRSVRLNGTAVQVVGVMPPGFRVVLPPDAGVGVDVDVWVPLLVPLASLHRDERLLDQDSDNTGAVVARLAPGVTTAAAAAEARSIGAALREEVPAYAAAGLDVDVRPLHADATAHARGLLLALMAGAGVVLVVACLDIAGLVVARGTGRSGELAVRTALGAGRGRIVRQLVVEGLVLVGLGLAAAVLVAPVAAGALASLAPERLAASAALAPGLGALVVSGGAAGVAVLLAGLLPARRLSALEGRGRVGTALGRGGPQGARARRLLASAEVALSVVLVLGAGLLLRSVAALQDVRPGFEPEGALTFDLSMRVVGRFTGPAERARHMKAVEAAIGSLPGVSAVGWVGVLPLAGDRWTQPYGLPGQAPSEWEANRADFRVASSGYFDALGTRLLEGRTFTSREDVEEEERVVVVDEKLARRIAPTGSALDAVIGVPVDGAPVEARVVGVVEHVRYERLEADGREAVYVPYRQEASRDVSFVVRSTAAPAVLAPAVRAAVRDVDPALPVHAVRSLDAYVEAAVAPRRFALSLLAAFAGLALACAALGLYGVVAFEVGRRRRDLGLRLAVGASPGRVRRAVVGSGLRLAAPGLAAGALLAAACARGLRSVLFGVGSADPAAWFGALGLVACITALACWLPARRASRLDPAAILRGD